MKTKFILHGGFNVSRPDEDMADFYVEILKDAPENARILLVPFAKELDRVVSTTTRVSAEFEKIKGQKDIFIEIANEESFLKQIESADVVYFQGGVSVKLLDALKQYPDLGGLLSGKIVAGESAGANVLCTYFYSPHADDVFEGLKILPIKIIPHYTEDTKGKLDGLDENLETLLLREYEYKVYYK